MIAAGSCIGGGIFVTPTAIFAGLDSPILVIAVWSLGGFIALTGSLTFAELGSIFTKSGGVYVYLKEAYGDFVAFAYGWCLLLVINTGALAFLSLSFTKYLGFFTPLTDTQSTFIAIAGIAFATAVNVFGIKNGQLLINIFTILKLLGIAMLVVFAFMYFDDSIYTTQLPEKFEDESLSSAFSIALIGVLFSTGGWHHASYLAGEAENPKRNVPRAMVIGVILVTVVYILVNMSYMALLPTSELGESTSIASDALSSVWPAGGKVIAILIIISIFGTVAIYTMSAPRIYQTMADDGVFFKGIAKIHPKYKTPVNAILFQSAWSVVLLLFWGTFHSLISYVVFTDWLFMLLAAIGVFIFRKQKRENLGGYKTWGYPLTPIIFILIIIWFSFTTLIEQPMQALAGLAVIGLSVPVYFYFKSKKD